MIFNAEFFGIPYGDASLIILNLILIESMLSVDNAAVLASMAMKLPKEKRGKALRYGIFGAYFFRGICLVLATWLVHFWWLKLIGGGYLLFQAFKYFIQFRKKSKNEIKEESKGNQKSKLFGLIIGKIGPFWGTVIAIEIMDLAFSLDNVLAAVAYTDPGHYASEETKKGSLYLLWFGVFIGILAMRFVSQGFVKLMEKFPFLENASFFVIGLLGIKITFDGIIFLFPHSTLGTLVADEKIKHSLDLTLSITTICIFFLPIIFSLIFRKRELSEK